jgi:hypothetical protein
LVCGGANKPPGNSQRGKASAQSHLAVGKRISFGKGCEVDHTMWLLIISCLLSQQTADSSLNERVDNSDMSMGKVGNCSVEVKYLIDSKISTKEKNTR